MMPIESRWYNPNPELLSVRIENPVDRGHFGTNGKGRTTYYALASGYAEFIERLQNGFVTGANGLSRQLLNSVKKKTGYYYFPDERLMTEDEFINLPKEYLTDIYGNIPEEQTSIFLNEYFGRLKCNGLNGVISVPFYDVKNNREIHLPYNLTVILSGSNGMASGNSGSEAIFQALCELIERLAARTVFFDQLTPPSIPDSYLQKFQDEYKIIQTLRQSGYNIVVKDFSCGLKLPAVGVIIIDESCNKYRLNIGAETSFRLALSRALTEIYQGIGDDDIMKQLMLKIPVETQTFFIDDSPENMRRRELEIQKFIVNGQGVFPISLFKNNSSYSFTPSQFCPKSSYHEEVKHLINLFNTLRHSVYIRDVSFLGFPTYYVFIPTVSVWGRKTNNNRPTVKSLLRGIEHDKLEDVLFPTQSLLDDPLRMAQALDILAPNRDILYTGLSVAKILKLEISDDCDISSMPVNFLITLLCFANKEYRNAKKFLNAFMEETSMKTNDYYLTVQKLFSAYEKSYPDDKLRELFPMEILHEFSSIKNSFKNIRLPTCPNCSICPYHNKCYTSCNYSYHIRILDKMKKHASISQQQIREIVT